MNLWTKNKKYKILLCSWKTPNAESELFSVNDNVELEFLNDFNTEIYGKPNPW